MDMSLVSIALIIGICLSLLFEEFFGITPGGMIVPGYLALRCNDIATLILVVGVSLLTFLIVEKILMRFMTIFGKRKFAFTMIISIVLCMLVNVVFPSFIKLPFFSFDLNGIGAITPALLSNNYSRQGIGYTLLGCAIVTALTFGIINILLLIA